MMIHHSIIPIIRNSPQSALRGYKIKLTNQKQSRRLFKLLLGWKRQIADFFLLFFFFLFFKMIFFYLVSALTWQSVLPSAKHLSGKVAYMLIRISTYVCTRVFVKHLQWYFSLTACRARAWCASPFPRIIGCQCPRKIWFTLTKLW